MKNDFDLFSCILCYFQILLFVGAKTMALNDQFIIPRREVNLEITFFISPDLCSDFITLKND